MRAFQQQRAVLRVASARLVYLSAFAVTLASSARTLALVFEVKAATGSLAITGMVVACSAVGAALCAPIRGRLVDTYGQTRVLIPMVLIHMAAWISLTGLVYNVRIMAVLAFTGGASFPPVFACLRSAWTYHYADDKAGRSVAYSMTSAVQNAGIVLGPVSAAWVSAFATPRVALTSAVCVTGIGTFIFAATRLSRSVPHRSAAAHPSPAAWRGPGLWALAVAGLCLGVQVGTLYLGVPGIAPRNGAGILLALVAAGQICGALVYGQRQWRGSHGTQAGAGFIALALLGALLFGSAHSLPLAASIVLLQGVALGVIEVVVMHLAGNVAPRDRSTEVFTWVASGQLAGMAVGSSVAGSLAVLFGTASAFVTMVVAATLAALVIFAAKRYVNAAAATPAAGPATEPTKSAPSHN